VFGERHYDHHDQVGSIEAAPSLPDETQLRTVIAEFIDNPTLFQ
jgi:hypothetical protein